MSEWVCSQGDNKPAVGGTWNLFGEPIPMCAEHLEDARLHGASGEVMDLETYDKAFWNSLGIEIPSSTAERKQAHE